MDLTKIKDIKFKFDEKAKLRAQIGLSFGIIPMFIAAFIAIVILSQLQVWYKIAAGFGLGCAAIMQIGGAFAAIGRYKAYVSAMAEYEKMNTEQVPASYHG